jgi:uncharacterized phage protein (TIGR01671 family)
MREIKFRAWDPTLKEFLLLAREVAFIDDEGCLRSRIEGILFNQYTGLLDRHGNEIYEDDIVIWDGGQYIVTFSEDEGSWILKDDRADWECPSLYGVSSPQQSRIIVLGNVHLHPELTR